MMLCCSFYLSEAHETPGSIFAGGRILLANIPACGEKFAFKSGRLLIKDTSAFQKKVRAAGVCDTKKFFAEYFVAITRALLAKEQVHRLNKFWTKK